VEEGAELGGFLKADGFDRILVVELPQALLVNPYPEGCWLKSEAVTVGFT
jgi:hypothetical protein